MPSPRLRSSGSRLLLPAGLGIAALLTVGSVGTGSNEALGPLQPIDVVAGAVDITPPAAPIDDGQALAAARAAPAPPMPTVPVARPAIPLAGPAIPVAAWSIPVVPPPLSELWGYRSPLPKGRLTQPFGPTEVASRVVDGKPFHDGIDLATFCGDRIVAAHDGVVLAAGRHFDDAIGWLGNLTSYYKRLDAKKLWMTLPNVVVIDDGNGYRSMYAHFERVVVKPGRHVRAGELLGYEGRTGNASGCHLHYGLFSPFERGEIAIDPGVAKRMKLPRAEIGRVDPLLVLPARPKPNAKPRAAPSTAPSTIPADYSTLQRRR